MKFVRRILLGSCSSSKVVDSSREHSPRLEFSVAVAVSRSVVVLHHANDCSVNVVSTGLSVLASPCKAMDKARVGDVQKLSGMLALVLQLLLECTASVSF